MTSTSGTSIRSPFRRTAAAIGLCVLPLVSVAACGSDSNGGIPTEGLPGTVHVSAILSLTTAVSFAGTGVQDGVEFALKEVESENLLEGTKLNFDFVDDAGDPKTGITEVRKIVRSDASVVVGPFLSSVSLAVTPIIQSAKIPELVVESGTPGVVDAGDYIYRITPPANSYSARTIDCLKARGITKAAQLYQSDLPTTKTAGEDVFPAAAKDNGIQLESVAYTGGQTDFNTLVTRLLSSNPEAVGVVTGNSGDIGTIMNQLRQAGFDGQLFGVNSFTPDILQEVGPAAKGTIWATAFSDKGTAPTTQEFVEKWKAAHGGEAPNQFHADGYDAVHLIVNALKDAGSADRKALNASIAKLTSAGYDGAFGTTTFENRDAVGAGVVNEFDGSSAVLAKC